MTIYEFYVESATEDVRLEVPRPRLSGSVELMQRLDAMIERGAGRRLGTSYGDLAADLTVADVRELFKDVRKVHVGQPGSPGRGPLLATNAVLTSVPPGSLFTAVFFEI